MRRLAILLAVVAALAANAFAQAPRLTINGVTSNTNGAKVDVPYGSKIVVEIADLGNPNGGYAFLGALDHNSLNVGFWLRAQVVPPFVKPWALITGIPTSAIEAKYSVDIFPDLSGSPSVRLNSSGKIVLVYQIPTFDPGTPAFSVFLQGVTRDSQSNLDVTNGIELTLHPTGVNAAYTVARGPDQDNTQLGAVAFEGDPSAATFTTLFPGPFEMLPISAVGFFQLIKSEASDNLNITSPESFGRNKVGRYRENPEFSRLTIPAATGTDGKTIPARDLYRIRDKGQSLSGFLVMNQGENPNTPGQHAFFPVGSLRQDPGVPDNADYYLKEVLIAWDNVHAFVGATDSDPSGDPKLAKPRLFIMAIDGTAPYTDALGAPTAMKDVTPVHDPVWRAIPTNAAFGCKNKIYFFTSEDFNFTNFGNKSLYWVPIDGSSPPTEVQVDPLRFNNQIFRGMDEDSVLVAEDGSVGAFVGQYDLKTEDYYAVNSISNPSRAVNVSGWRDEIKMAAAGQATDGTALCALSPGGRWLAYCTDRSGPDDLFLASTDGTSAENNRRLSNAFGGSLNDCRDPVFVDENNLIFFYGNDAGQAYTMDMYRYEISLDRFTNVTGTSGEVSPPYTTFGTVHSRGEFFSDSRRFLYFLRDGAKT